MQRFADQQMDQRGALWDHRTPLLDLLAATFTAIPYTKKADDDHVPSSLLQAGQPAPGFDQANMHANRMTFALFVHSESRKGLYLRTTFAKPSLNVTLRCRG